MGSIVNLDPGVRFVPTDEEVVMEYLVKVAMGEALPGNYVIERDLYADKAPWEILMTTINNHEEGQGQGGGDVAYHHLPWMNIRSRDENSGRIKKECTIYVLTALKKASRSSNRIGRRAGCGGWHGDNGNKIVEVETGCVIGYKNSGRINKESTIYVLTALKKASRSSNRIGRRARCGGWHGENGNKIVEAEEENCSSLQRR